MRLAIILLFFLTTPCHAALIDTEATTETTRFYNHLSSISGDYMYFGHQFTYTRDWVNQDVFAVTGKYPYIMAVDFELLEDNGIGTFTEMTRAIKQHHARGGFITVSWHIGNPVTGGIFNDTSGDPTPKILPRGANRAQYLARLDELAVWLNSLVDANGKKIPILFRPYHETDVPTFWWARGNTTDADYVSLWRDLVTYIKDTKGIHHLIWVWSVGTHHEVSRPRYPGDDWYDILGVDCYSEDPTGCLINFNEMRDHAVNKGKLYAITEGVASQVPTVNNTLWTDWTDTATDPSKAHEAVYAAIWASPDWGPVKGRSDEDNFRQAMRNPKIRVLEAKKAYRARMRNVVLKGMRINAQ